MRASRKYLRQALSLLVIATLALSCGLPQPDSVGDSAREPADHRDATVVAAAPAAPATLKLPFTGRLVEGDRDELPPAIAGAIVENSPVTFAYREQLTHDEYHIPLIVSALDPVTFVGAPLGDFGVTAFATLTIRERDVVLGDYTAKAFVSRPYTLYSSPTHRELETAARTAVRDKIDEKLGRDALRLGHAVRAGAAGPTDLR
jgi:hypothetical protein